jgi:trimeric autotransporter adhesin
LKASNTRAGDQFGTSVAIDGNLIAVGASGQGGSSGAVYLFERTTGIWTQQAFLKASNRAYDDVFGQAVAISSDTVAVGASGENSNASGVGGNQLDDSVVDSGAVYVFK